MPMIAAGVSLSGVREHAALGKEFTICAFLETFSVFRDPSQWKMVEFFP